MVIRGGENLFPVEIEDVLFQHPAVASVQVDRRARRAYGRGIDGVGGPA